MNKLAVKRARTKRMYTILMAERSFVRDVMERKVTPEVEAFTVEATRRSHQVRNAAFLNKFRKLPLAA